MQIQTHNKVENLTTWATDINHHHTQACLRAGEAVNHAIEAGKLLMHVKSRLPHGEFGDWLGKNLDVTDRQARRYMAAAQGKPVPARAIASNRTPVSVLPAPVKNDTVSLFKIRPGEVVAIESDNDGWIDSLHILPSVHNGFFHYMFTSGKEGEGCSSTFSKRPMRTEFIQSVINREMPDWEFANITRTKSAGFEYNVIGVTPDGTEWIGSPPWVKSSEAVNN